jgi:hypothetical protein
MDIYFSITNSTAEAWAMAAVLIAACISAGWVVVTPARRREVVPDKATPQEPAFECDACGIQYHCSDKTLDRPLRCPHCGTANKET